LAIRASVFALFLGLTSGATAHAQARQLRWRFAPQQRYEIQIEQSTELETEVDLVKQTVRTATGLRSRWTVVGFDARQVAQIEMVLVGAKLNVTMPTTSGVRTLEVDSAVEDKDADAREIEMRQNLQAILGKPIRLSVTDRGEIVGVELDASTKEAIRTAPQSMQIRQAISEEGLRELFASAIPVLPEGDVEPNVSWTLAKEFGNPLGRFRRDHTFTWQGSESRGGTEQEKIGVSATLTPISPASLESTSPPVTIKSQATTGTIWFDAARGLVSEADIAAQLTTVAPYREKKIQTRADSRIKLAIERSE
jgi:hypothetical protein